jgi:hypothetical protein
MRIRSRLSLVALLAVAALAAAVGIAGARRIEFSEQHIRAVWGEAEPAGFIDSGGNYNIRCQLSLEGSFHSRTLSKVCGQLIGYITQAQAPFTCAGGEIAVLNGNERNHANVVSENTLPWHVRYDSFTGTLPNIAGIRIQIIGAAILYWITTPFIATTCLYKSEIARPLFAILEVGAGGVITAMRFEETFSFLLFARLGAPEIFCPSGAKITKRTTSFTVQGGTSRITVRLVQ